MEHLVRLIDLIELFKEEQLNAYHIIEQVIRISESNVFPEDRKEEMILARLHFAGLNFIKMEFINEGDKIPPKEKSSKINEDGSFNINAFLIPCDIMVLDLMNTSVRAIVVMN